MAARRNQWASFLTEAASDVRRLNSVDRFSSIPVRERESVALHSYWVVLYSLMLHRRLDGPGEALGSLLSYAAVHDLPECLTGDVVRTFKYSSGEFREAVQAAEHSMVERLPKPVLSMLRRAESMSGDGTWEHGWYVETVAKAADFLSLYQYLMRELRGGNSDIGPFVKAMRADMNKMRKKVSESFRPAADPRRSRILTELADLYKSMSTLSVKPKFVL
ncbi:MAG: 5'-nucleotidase [Synergistetes bacterium ADurb.BinA166]|nr:MAG: 5'-nucleotidase [Synergistetes bacterium ADurb.BinA166]